ncbi:MAG: peptide-methionine (S)-S-oxide reductase [Desulfuromonas sp.]|nr:MAG: peptide-methionine (S)-S-oxide reductase [Desulfuromonas sp.]
MDRLLKSVLVPILLAILSIQAFSAETHTRKDSQAVTHESSNARATFAGGCFWCMEPPFDKLKGVKATISGYMGGSSKDPTYQEVSSGTTGHAEVVQVVYDPALVSYQQLLDIFWTNINPTDDGGQFVDRGTQYRSAIFYHNEEQKQLAEISRTELAASGRFTTPIVTEIVAAGTFYPAEEYHQDYYLNSPVRYKFYRYNSGRDQFLNKVWGEKND